MPKLLSSLAATAGLALMLVGPAGALAADMPPPPPPPEIRGDWTGPYVGGLVGGACMETVYVPSVGSDPDLNGCTFLGGVVGGFNYQFGNNVVVGIEGDYVWGGQAGTNHLDRVNYDIDNMTTVRGRVGWLHSDTLFYGTAGVGWLFGNLEGLVGPSSIHQSDDDVHTGWVVGGGIEHAFSANLHGRLEYLYGSFNSRKYDLSVSTCATPCIVDLDFKHLHTVRASLTWNFGSLFW